MMKIGHVTQSQRQVIAKFAAEMVEAGCDAVVVIGTGTVKNKTKSFVAQHGNELLCNSLIHHAFQTETFVYADLEDETDE